MALNNPVMDIFLIVKYGRGIDYKKLNISFNNE
jgi:hypothetical protein